MKAYKEVFLFVFICLASLSVAQDSYAYRKGKVKHRLSVGLVKSFYINHPEHTINTKSKFGYTAAYKTEIFMSRRANLMFGLEYMSHGLTFQGYYKKPGYTYLFDRTYAYTHELRIQEVDVPIALKINFNIEKDHSYTPYITGAFGMRYIFSSYSVITNDSTGITVYDAKDNIDFENQLQRRGLNAYFQLGLGLQRNMRSSARALYFEINYRRGISRIHYNGDNNSNSLNIRDAHLLFMIGMRL